MTPTPDRLDENITRLLGVALGRAVEPKPDYQPVMQALVAQRRRRRARRTWSLAGTGALAAAAAILLVLLPKPLRRGMERAPAPTVAAAAKAGEVKLIYGLVSLGEDQEMEVLAREQEVAPGQWVWTHTGSLAELLLEDQSRLIFQPRTRVRLLDMKDGHRLLVSEGLVRIQAAHQPPGRSLTIQTPSSRITVLGTTLDVRVGESAPGRKQTRVSVTSGKVRLESAGKEVVLLPNMEGLSEQGLPPQARSLTAEVNDLAELATRTGTLAAEQKLAAGDPIIVQFDGDASATVWTFETVGNPTDSSLTEHVLVPAQAQSLLAAFTSEGVPLATTRQGEGFQVDLSSYPVPPRQQRKLIVKATDVRGLFSGCGSGTFEAVLPAGKGGRLSLIQVALPASARVEDVFPPPNDTHQIQGRLAITIAADVEAPKVLK